MLWETAKIVKLVEAAAHGLGIHVSATECGGDYDTEAVSVIFGAEGTLWIRGFRTGKPLDKHDMVDIDMVEVEDGGDSRGGLSSSGENICVGYGKIVSALRRAGYVVVPSMKGYF